MKVSEFGKAAQPDVVQAVPLLIEPEHLPWWVALQSKPRAEWHTYREKRLLKADGKIPRAVGEI